MTKYKIIIIFAFLLIVNKSFSSSRLKYDDIYKVILSGDKDKAYTLLTAYQKQNPNFANTYFQLGIIAKEWAKNFNPFTEFEYTKLFIYNTKLYFSLAKLKMKDEKNKNRYYYKNAPIIPKGKKLKLDDINAYIDSQIEDITDYENNIVKIINYYNKSSDSYNECVSIFMKINSDYAKIKNIYLSDDDSLNFDLKNLETNFDSTLIYFNLYKEALKKFPIPGYDQTYKLKDIVTYRLDGLNYSDFLKNNIILWNYKKWIQGVRTVKNKVIKNNRTDIADEDKKLKSKINTLETGIYSDEYKHFKLSPKFVYKIEKFDNNSLLVKLFKLNETKINYLVNIKKAINDPVTITKFPILKRAEYCFNLLKEKEIADSINKIFINAITPEQVKKYKNFYVSKYEGMQGLQKYSFRQELFFEAKLNDALLNLKKQLYYTSFKINTDSLIYQNKSISTEIVNPATNLSDSGKYHITNFIQTKNNHLWFTGFEVSKDNKKHGFTGYTEDFKHVKFIKNVTPKNSSETYNTVCASYQGGCFIISTETGSQITNTLINYNNKGDVIFKNELPYHKIPRLMKYDDINNVLLIVFNGQTFNNIPDDPEQIIYHYNPDDQLQTYEVKISAKAEIFDMIRVNNKMLLFSNFINYTDLNGNIVSSKAGNNNKNTNVLVTIISKGLIKKQIPFFSSNSFFGVKALKINSNTINILGYKSEMITSDFKSLNLNELYYELINPAAHKIYSAWHD